MRKLAPFLVSAALLMGTALPLASVRAVSVTPVDATAYVLCEGRQGSGVYLSGTNQYLLTAGHVVEDPATRIKATSCQVAFGLLPDGGWSKVFTANVVFSVYDDRLDRDFAMLKIVGGPTSLADLPTSGYRVGETVAVGDTVTFLGFPSGAKELQTAHGKILGFRRGVIRTDAVIAEGYSGGPIVDAAGRLIGIATRLIVVIDENGKETIEDYEAADLLGIENWLDTEKGGHDLFLEHAEPSFVHGTIPLIRVEAPPCSYLVRTLKNTAVYCLVPGMRRLTFPTTAVYQSWYSDFKEVRYVSEADLADYQLVANITMKAGSFIKLKTDPKVYYVADNMGTLRWVTTEAAAKRLAGDGWAKQVRDVQDTFFLNYRVGRALD